MMKTQFALTVAVIIMMATVGYAQQKPGPILTGNNIAVVATQYGKVRGYIDDDIYAFKGIPYAKAERFMPPQAPDKWENVRQSTIYGPQAMQSSSQNCDIIWHGDRYRLLSPWENDFAAILYEDEERSNAIIFNYLVSNRYRSGSVSPVKLKSLNADKKNSVREINLYPDTKSPLPQNAIYSGDYLMDIGISPNVRDRRPSVILEVTEVK
ncbi:MAG: carboxylesterase family protein [Ginsengibacter sp.]